MCGICGELTFDGAPVDETVIAAMRERLAHRGPDSAGLYVAPGRRLGLGFRRLRIIDLRPEADQPMANEDATVRIVFNGEIYNFQDLRRDLVARGHRFRSRSDTETIVHLYEEYGPGAIERLDGMFALALWDEREGRLLLARDRAGKKPLFYYRDAHRLVFGSEIKALFAHPAVAPAVDPSAVPAYFLYGYVPGPATPYRDIRSLPPGTTLSLALDGATTAARYWQLAYPPAAEQDAVRAPDAEVVARVRDLVTEGVRRRLVSDVPLGAFLSGGIDSTVIVGVMSRLSPTPVRTFSIGFEGDAAFDETEAARRTAERFRTEHTEFRVRPSAVDLIDRLVWHHDGPFGDSSAIPTYLVSELTRQQVTVVLTGDGGDEVFAGYLRFRAALAAERVPAALGRLVAAAGGLLGGSHPRSRLARAVRFGEAAGLPLHERVTRWNSFFDAGLEDLVAGSGPVDRLQHLAGVRDGFAGRSPLSQLLLANFASYLPDDLLVKVDRCTMAHSLEARAPLLDTALVEYVAALPDRWKVAGTRAKVALREAFADLIPPEIDRRPKMGFGVPLDAWFRGPLRDYAHDVLDAPNARFRAYVSGPAVAGVLREHEAGAANHGQRLWALLSFERWLQLLPSWSAAALAPPVR